MKKLAAALLSIVFAVSLTPITNADTGKEMINEKFPIEFLTTDECNMEEIAVTGTMHLVAKFRTDKNGAAHTDTFATIHGRAVGVTSGNEYIYADTFRSSEDFGITLCEDGINTAPYEFKQYVHSRLLSKGSLPNSYLKFTVRFSTDANCNFGMEVIEEKFDCRG